MIETAQLVGRTDSHVTEIFPGHRLHRELVAPYARLVEQAGAVGIDLRIASGYRSFERQLTIWNAKVSGELPVIDDDEKTINLDALSDLEKVFAILRWSALPGASRHHWGTEVDVWDAAAVPAGYNLQLSPEEYSPGGVFRKLCGWLDTHLAGQQPAFSRPYLVDRGGVAPEPWHLSYRPLADQYQNQLQIGVLHGELVRAGILLKETLLAHLDEIVQRFVMSGD